MYRTATELSNATPKQLGGIRVKLTTLSVRYSSLASIWKLVLQGGISTSMVRSNNKSQPPAILGVISGLGLIGFYVLIRV